MIRNPGSCLVRKNESTAFKTKQNFPLYLSWSTSHFETFVKCLQPFRSSLTETITALNFLVPQVFTIGNHVSIFVSDSSYAKAYGDFSGCNQKLVADHRLPGTIQAFLALNELFQRITEELDSRDNEWIETEAQDGPGSEDRTPMPRSDRQQDQDNSILQCQTKDYLSFLLLRSPPKTRLHACQRRMECELTLWQCLAVTRSGAHSGTVAQSPQR